MKTPIVNDEFFTEREGINAVSMMVNSMRCIWRETINKDIGIDGQIERLDDNGKPTGHIIAVQVKSGSSYIKLDEIQENITFYPHKKHISYWENFPIPVIIIIYDPIAKTAYWSDVRFRLRSINETENKSIKIPLSQKLDLDHKDSLFLTCGTIGGKILDMEQLLLKMINTVNDNITIHVSFLDLFLFGLTDIGRKLFFTVGLFSNLGELKMDVEGFDFGIGLGGEDHDFIDQYINFLVIQNLVFIDYSDILIDQEREVSSTFLCPLTSRGKALVNYIHEIEERLRKDPKINYDRYSITSDHLIDRVSYPYGHEFSQLAQIKQFSELFTLGQVPHGEEL